ncbi:tumor necrosis factor ligand superfamily member 13B isoform X2 [Boleophthalmus pectinirostris]|uniref:tumor necrosis factor ligand superfamily member 13B isoform X2 n=1 Tax=Boleophthalmus pectinirostris TaxID=150288 RepID=UPI00242F3345|nr:tumor necrosis factor ligand superfamily member 13B isoform X2 [Boleophthalmus pectinirostris]
MAAGVKPGSDPQRKLSWPVLLLILTAVTSSSLSALSLYQLVVLRADVEWLKSEVCHRRQEGQEDGHIGQVSSIMDNICPRSNRETLQRLESEHASILRKKRQSTGKDIIVSQPCLQLMANGNRKPFNKEFDFDEATGIPWQTGLKRGTALEEEQDRILILQEGYYYVYSQVYYKDTQIAMGQVVIRWKASVVGNEASHVVLFRCIKNMRHEYSFNTCFTGGVVKLETGDHLELLIPRAKANITLDGEGTFMGAIKLV